MKQGDKYTVDAQFLELNPGTGLKVGDVIEVGPICDEHGNEITGTGR